MSQSKILTSNTVIPTSILLSLKTDVIYNTEVYKNNPDSTHVGEIECICKQCVPGIFSIFRHAKYKANDSPIAAHAVASML